MFGGHECESGTSDDGVEYDKFEAHLIAVGFAESMFYNIAYHRGGYAYDRHHAVVDRAPAEHAEGKQAEYRAVCIGCECVHGAYGVVLVKYMK